MATLRVDLFTPYRRGMGPRFVLKTFDLGAATYGFVGRSRIGYELTQRDPDGTRTVLFAGKDFSPSPMHAIDSRDTIAGLMGFLTLRPGDTDRAYFADYTPVQIAFAETHAESLSCAVDSRFHCEDCGSTRERRTRTRCNRCHDRARAK
jgi:hypothetical protein